MSVWFVCPSKRRPEEAAPVLHRWIDTGYNVLVQRDPGDSIGVAHIQRPYKGYPEAVNHLMRFVLQPVDDYVLPDWIVTGGDDTLPDPTHPSDEIAHECLAHFGGTFGVMQPTGDRWGECADAHEFKPRRGSDDDYCACGRGRECDQHLKGAYIDRSAGSPWIGREFARRMYGGRGPFCEEYFHMFDDSELQEVATRMGVFWQRRDLIHMHQHWGRNGRAEDMPDFLRHANSPENWRRSKEIFERRKAGGFPGHDPIL